VLETRATNCIQLLVVTPQAAVERFDDALRLKR
jgi:hypothetical protein